MKFLWIRPIAQFPVNSHYVLAVYNGKLSTYDIVIRYRQLENDKWSRIRTPKHVHWAVDILLKQHSNKRATAKFIDLLLSLWDKMPAITTESVKGDLLNSDVLLADVEKEAKNYLQLANKGEYSIKFLYLLAKLLIIQEKTNKDEAYMFKSLLEALKEHKNIFNIVQIATAKYVQ
ncbi:MAG: hypothetical protein ACI392_02280 [Paludibacteraceae bacterium]